MLKSLSLLKIKPMGPEDEKRIEETQEYIRAYEAAGIQVIKHSNLQTDDVRTLLDELPEKHHLDGAARDGSPPLLLFRLPAQISAKDLTADGFLFWLRGWPGFFGASLTFKVLFAGRRDLGCRTCVPHDSPVFDSLREGRFHTLFARNGKVVSAFEVDFARSPISLSKYMEHWTNVNGHTATFNDNKAHYWEVLSGRQNVLELPRDRLSARWVRAYNVEIRNYLEMAEKARTAMPIPDVSNDEVLGDLAAFLDRLRDPVLEFRAFLDYFEERVRNPKFIPAFFDAAKKVMHLCGNDLPGRGLYLYMISSSMTRCGTALAWLDGENLTFRQIELNPEEIERKGALDDYWASLPSPNPYVNWGYLIKGHDVPIDPEDNDRGWSRFSIDGSVQEISASADALLEEAVADKKWTIPRHAIVELSFGPFNSLEVSEIGREVYFVCRTAGERFQIASVRPDKHICTFRPAFEVDGMDPEQKARVEAGVKLLFSAIIRDFWVVEEREKVFSTREISPREAGRAGSDADPRIVYIPRIKYSHRPDLERCARELAYEERRAHFVSAHLRRADNPSEHQLFLAERYGFEVPIGYTFVRPHERGKQSREIIYRSRSAIQSLYTVIPEQSGTTRPKWFQFERDVHALMRSLGFEVQHIASHPQGGVDLYASKGSDLDYVNWIIQCKCFAPKHKVGPAIVRDLVGTLHRYPPGTRGMIVTTSSFSSGAIEEARRAGIRRIDGREFVELIQRTKNS